MCSPLPNSRLVNGKGNDIKILLSFWLMHLLPVLLFCSLLMLFFMYLHRYHDAWLGWWRYNYIALNQLLCTSSMHRDYTPIKMPRWVWSLLRDKQSSLSSKPLQIRCSFWMRTLKRLKFLYVVNRYTDNWMWNNASLSLPLECCPQCNCKSILFMYTLVGLGPAIESGHGLFLYIVINHSAKWDTTRIAAAFVV